MEKAEQTKIIKFLNSKGFKVSKTIAITSGHPDITGCDPKGRFICIEVKTKKGKASLIQERELNQFRKRGAVALICFGFIDFKEKIIVEYPNINSPDI